MAKEPTPKQLELFERKADRTIESAEQQVVRGIRDVFTNYINRTKGMLADVGAREGERIALAEQEAVVRDLRDFLIESGYQEFVDEFNGQLAEMGRDALNYGVEFYDAPRALGGATQEALDRLATDFLEDINFQVDQKLLRPMEATTRRAFLNLETREAVVQDILSTINNEGILRRDGKKWTNINVEVATAEAQRQFHQFTRNEHTKELGLDIAVYVGPLDHVTSPQCRTLLGFSNHGISGYYYREEVTAGLHPALRGNPLITRGHPQCRHSWYFVDLDSAKAEGFIP